MLKPSRDFIPKKSLGQNFLCDDNVAKKIIRMVAPQPDEVFVEIGPGFGALTQHLAASGCRCYAVEIDERLLAHLHNTFEQFDNLKILHGDFRKVELESMAGPQPIRLIGNVPYHITSHLVFRAFAQRHLLRDMTMTIQKEVAERVVATPGGKEYGILSVVSQTFAEVKLWFTLSPHVFRPKPEVDSAVIHWHIQAPPLAIADEEFFLTIVKSAFAQRRKTLRRSLAAWLKDDTEAVDQLIDLQRRPETLTVAEFITLANSLHGMR